MKRFNWTPARGSVSSGFTLIEVMVVIAVVAILAAVAYPSYMEHVRRGWRAEARTALMQEMQQQERVYSQRAKYKTKEAHRKFSGDDDASSKYDIEVGGCAGREADHCIKLTANLRSTFSDPVVGNIWIDSTGAKGCDGGDARRCWQ